MIKKTLTFDYQAGTFTVLREGTNRRKVSRTKTLPKEEFDDLLTALYNFRLESYGEITSGKNFSINILVKEKPSRISIVLPNQDQIPKPGKSRGAYYTLLSMERDLTQAFSKQFSGWLAKDLVPVTLVVEDAYLFGDIKAILKERKFVR